MRAAARRYQQAERSSVFTQCPQCETVFRLSADALGAAGGQVRCGRCGEVFDSLKRLAEEPRMFAIGESTLELEARAEQILESLGIESRADPEPTQTNVDEIGSVESGEPEPAIDRSLEFSLTPTDLDRIFIGGVDTGHEPPPADAPDDLRVLDDEYQHDERRRRDDVHPADEDPAPEEPFEHADSSAPAHAPVTEWEAEALLQPKQIRRWPYIVASILLALLLAAQVVHRNREWLASRGALGGALRTLYAALGSALPAPATLSGYQLRQWGASGDEAANGQLRVRASILNTTTQLQPFPLLRVTLEDRFGAPIGIRIFEPAEYSGKPLTRLLGPGERADATVDIQDPGKNAEGFEVDVCLRSAAGKISCASDFAPHPP
jgi:predicted Zn finger-like uncharacterized protein